MISVSDILKILEKIPEWAGLKAMLRRIDELERRVAALEAAGTGKISEPRCPLCETGVLKTKSVRPDPTFGDMGVQQHTLVCSDCSHTERRQITPG